MDKKEYLLHAFEIFGMDCSDRQCEQFLQYEDLLTEWNQKMNLTAITDFEEIVWKHFIDSLAVSQSVNVSRETLGGYLIDVGTGAGFPGIPLNIMYPSLKVTLLDSLQKRITFLDEVIRACHLKQIRTVHGRAEDLAHDPKYREQYDLCVSRAVANMATLSEYCLPYLKKGGRWIAYKSGEIEVEVAQAAKAIKVFGGECRQIEKFTLRGTELSRSLVLVRKKETTPRKYPRKAGVPQKKPIL